nr:COP9 signalosome complex subunit 4 [Ipomoea batatas]
MVSELAGEGAVPQLPTPTSHAELRVRQSISRRSLLSQQYVNPPFDSELEVFVDVGGKLADESGEIICNLSTVLFKSSQPISWSRSMRNWSRELVDFLLFRQEYVDPVKQFSYSRSALRFSVMKVMTKNSEFQLSDFKFDFFVDVGNKVSDSCGEAFSNLSAVLKSNQSSVSAVLTKSSSWSRSVRKSSRVLVNAVFDRESWSISSESLSAVLVRPSSIAIPGANPMEWKQFRGAVAEIDPLPPPPQPILRSSFIERSARVTSEASSARVKSKDIVVERKDVQMKLPECSCVEPEFQKEIAYHTLNQIQPRVVSFEEQVLIIREKLAKLYESEQQWSKAAQLFNGIDLKSGMRVVDDNFRLSKCVILIARLYLEDDYAVNVEAKFEVGIADLDGLDGIMVGVAVYAEFRKDWGEALRMYDDAYHVLRDIVSTSTRLPPIQRVVEIKTVAKQLNFNWQTMAAASLAYGSEKKNNETILVFDLGGGIFDVYVLEVGDGMFEMLSTSGDTHLGGDVFGKRTGNWLASNFKKDEGFENPLMACCGGSSAPYNANPNIWCGANGFTVNGSNMITQTPSIQQFDLCPQTLRSFENPLIVCCGGSSAPYNANPNLRCGANGFTFSFFALRHLPGRNAQEPPLSLILATHTGSFGLGYGAIFASLSYAKTTDVSKIMGVFRHSVRANGGEQRKKITVKMMYRNLNFILE